LAEKAAIKDFETAKQISSGAIPRLPPRPPGHVCPAGPGWVAPRQRHSLGGWGGLARKGSLIREKAIC